MVMSYTQLLAREYRGKLDSQADQFIAYAVEGAQRMETLLKGLRDYWSVNDQTVKPDLRLDCERVLDAALANLDGRIRESSAVITREPLPTVSAEEVPLVQLFQNLIGNAIKYRRADESPRIHISAQKSGDVWKFAVRDNGIGIEKEHLQSVFAPFKRLHASEYPGTGMGLAISLKSVERYRCRIWIESTYGQGSVFYFTLPARNGDV
jgi:light-regulated signal transduction histidine kinase (bacteriophytochrome)